MNNKPTKSSATDAFSIDTSAQESQTNTLSRKAKGEFVRGVSGFRNAIGDTDFPAEPGRYHLFVALNCPWCHRVILARNILGLQQSISMDVAFPGRTDDGDPVAANLWEFNPDRVATLTGRTLPECTLETATGKAYRLVKAIYEQEGSDERSVPILYDKVSHRVVNNESAEIIRILNDQATPLGSIYSKSERADLWPHDRRAQEQINELNAAIYTNINNGAYKAGFSSDQAIYAKAFTAYFDMLAQLESRLAAKNQPYLTGQHFTEADLRLFPTLFRHDPVYYVRMKLNGAKILDYPHLWRWLCRVYAMPGVAQSNSLDHCKQGYFGRSWNNVVPLGPTSPMAYPQAYEHPELATEQ